jgi:CRP/FNR family cyclic AMP-dependent transcriptional regulator
MNTILLIEDNPEIRENTAEILELANYKVVTAENGKDGIEKAASTKPDVIICDIMMPVLDGYGVLHMLNKNEELRDIPFIFLTAKTERLDFRKGMEMGADDYITKPFTELELLNAIEQRLKKVDLYKKRFAKSDEGMKTLLQDIGRQDVWNEFASDRNVNHYKRKSVIYSEGNHPNRLFYVKKGKVKLYKTNEDGKDLTIGLFGEGDYFGYLSLLENSVYHETAEAMEDSEIAMIPREEFDALVRENTLVMKKFLQILAGNVTEKENQLLGLAYNSLRKRVADALIMLRNKFGKDKSGFAIHISREDLANIAGTATESLIRTLSDFKAEKLIDIKEGNIVLLNEKKLESLLN